MMKEIYKILLAITLLTCTSSIIAMTSCKGEKDIESTPITRPVKTMVVGGNDGFSRSFPGKVQATQRVNLSFRVSGPLIDFPVDEGEEVVKGQLLARIDPRDYKIAVDEARAKFIEAEADYKRYRELYERDAVPLAELDVRRAKRDTARARLEEAQANLSDTRLNAPFPGFVGAKFVENYEEVKAFQNILSLNDISHIEIVIDLPESIIATPKNGRISKLYATFQTASDQEFPLEVKEVSAQADPRTQTYRATLSMPQPEEIRVLPGMTAQVHVKATSNELQGASYFVIPSYAVFAGATGKQYVWVVNQQNSTVHKNEVDVGSVTGSDGIEILGGLEPGEMIVLTGVTQLQDGMKIQPMGRE